MPIRTETSNAVPQGRPSNPWWLGVWLLVLGALLMGGGLFWSAHERQADARSVGLLSQMQAKVAVVLASARGAVDGDSAATAALEPERQSAQETWLILDRGTGGVHTLSQMGASPAVAQSWASLQSAWSVLQDNGHSLADAAQAMDQLPELQRQMQTAQDNLDHQASLANWATAMAPIRADLARADVATLRTVFAPQSSAAVQGQWVDMVVRRAQDATSLANQGGQDASLTTVARNALATWAERINAYAVAVRTLGNSRGARATTEQALPQIQSQTDQMTSALASLQQSLEGRRDAWLPSDLAALAGIVLLVVGLVVWIRWSSQTGGRVWALSQDAGKNSHLTEAMDRLLRRLSRAMGQNTGSGFPRLEEDPHAPTYPLVTQINRLGERQESVFKRGSEVLAVQEKGWNEQIRFWQAVLQIKGLSGTGRLDRDLNDLAEQLAQIAEHLRLDQERAQAIQQQAGEANALMQEGTWRTEALRETIQNTAKRLKRLGESTQNIGGAIHLIHELARRVQVLAMNAAIEAAGAGDHGRGFAALAQEIEQLAQSSGQVAKEITQLVADMRADAQETVAAMEQSTSEVVESGRVVARGTALMQSIETDSDGLGASSRRNIEAVEQRAVIAVQIQQQAKGLAGSVEEVRALAQKGQEQADQGRQQSVQWRRSSPAPDAGND